MERLKRMKENEIFKFRKAVIEDKTTIRALLQTAKLLTENLDKDVTTFYIAEENGQTAGIAGYEFYGDDALLRSVAVQPDFQHHGIGSQFVDFMLDEARKRKILSVVLLTETAKDFFLKKGFVVVDRSSIENGAMIKSSEFAYACPKSAVCMRLWLK